jgi:c-di-GMP-binding flagellar brake protein YcgR
MADSQQQKQAKKKRFRFFDTYIGNLLKEINSEKGITANTRQQLNSVLQYVTEILANKSRDITIKTSKRTVSDAEVLTATRLSFEGEFLEDMETKIKESLDKYSDSEKQDQSRTELVWFSLRQSLKSILEISEQVSLW